MSIEKIIPVDKELVNIFGVNDQNLKYLKDKFKKIKINVNNLFIYSFYFAYSITKYFAITKHTLGYFEL